MAIGWGAGQTGQGVNSIAMGISAGQSGQGTNAVAIGYAAGFTGQGQESIAIGHGAGLSAQANNTIIVNATGVALNGVSGQTGSCYIAPVRQNYGDSSSTLVPMMYNSVTQEVCQRPASYMYFTGSCSSSTIAFYTYPSLLQYPDFNIRGSILSQNIFFSTDNYLENSYGACCPIVVGVSGIYLATWQFSLGQNNSDAVKQIAFYQGGNLVQVNTAASSETGNCLINASAIVQVDATGVITTAPVDPDSVANWNSNAPYFYWVASSIGNSSAVPTQSYTNNTTFFNFDSNYLSNSFVFTMVQIA